MRTLIISLLFLQATQVSFAQSTPFKPSIALGTRMTYSPIPSRNSMGNGLGGQFRLWLKPRLNTEWFLDYLVGNTAQLSRKDFHIGWSVLLYAKNNCSFEKKLQPYLSVGHCFDKTILSEIKDPTNVASRLTMATHAGLGTHINLLPQFDCSFTGLYMFHLGKELLTDLSGEKPIIYASAYNHFDGHLMLQVSFNYRFDN